MTKLSRDFYLRDNVVQIARELLGKRIVSNINGQLSSGIIVETEAYSGKNDKACHANAGKLTKRTSVMFEAGGKAYVYLCYGIHHLFNIVTNHEGNADAVLIRAIQPDQGLEIMQERRNFPKPEYRISSGPGCLSQALGIRRSHNKTDLTQNEIWLEESNIEVGSIISSPRIGVDYAGEDAALEWRFYMKNNPWVSVSKR
ncbi:MAG: DNA-3-methyladenine glycosylase [Chitinophagales bacterium]